MPLAKAENKNEGLLLLKNEFNYFLVSFLAASKNSLQVAIPNATNEIETIAVAMTKSKFSISLLLFSVNINEKN